MTLPQRARLLLFGRPFATSHAEHTRLPNALALPVFASDALSSVSYATEEILLVLILAGATAANLAMLMPVGVAIAAVLAIVAFSYRQTIYAYPQGGGAYRVATDNLGLVPGLTAASALLVDYVLTVAVSVSAGVAAITSAFPELHDYTVPMACGFVLLVALANVRGAKESGLLFAVPTYLFLVSLGSLVAVGCIRLALGHSMTPPAPDPAHWAQPTEHLGIFLVLKAFSSGCTALTGIEAVSDGVPAFKEPAAKNAARVLAALGVILITLFLGITYLANRLGVVPFPPHLAEGVGRETVVSQIAAAVFGRGPLYLLVQAATAMILILAANTAYVDFPRLSQFLARDGFLPRQLAHLGDRLVYSNGIFILTAASILTIVAFHASTHALIPLYALGVFLSFTLSQSGMVVRQLRMKERGWLPAVILSGAGALVTFTVLMIIAITKFTAGEPVALYPLTTPAGFWIATAGVGWLLLASVRPSARRLWMLLCAIALATLLVVLGPSGLFEMKEVRRGAWIVMVAIPSLVWICYRINCHYAETAAKLSMTRHRPLRPFTNTILLLVPNVHRGIMPAIDYARSLSGDVRGVYVEIDPARTSDVLQRWSTYVEGMPLVVLESPYRSLTEPLMQYIDQVERERDDDIITVVIPEFVTDEWWSKILHNQSGLLLKWALLFKRGVVVTNIRYYLDEDPDEPARVNRHPLTTRI